MRLSNSLRKGFLYIVTTLVLLLAVVGVAEAVQERSVTRGSTDRTIYKFGRDITITGTVNGDVYCAGQAITIDAVVVGDVFCAGQTVNVHGTVTGSVRVAAQSVTLSAKVDGSVGVAGADVIITDKATVARDVSVAGDNVEIAATVTRDVNVAGTIITINGPVGRNVEAQVGQELRLRGSSRIGGDVNYTSERNKLERSPGAQVTGKVNYHKNKPPKQNGWFNIWQLYWLLATVILAMVLVALFPQLFKRWADAANGKYGTATLSGFLTMLGGPVILFGIAATLVGIPLSLLLLLILVMVFMLSGPMVMYIVGRRITPKWHPLNNVLAGGLLVGALQLIPVIGFFVTLCVLWLGSGIILLNLKRLYKRPNYSAK